MIQQMQLKGYSTSSIKNYTECIVGLANYYKTSPDLLSIEQVRNYIHFKLIEKKLSKSWVNQIVSALKILFCDILKTNTTPNHSFQCARRHPFTMGGILGGTEGLNLLR